MWGVPPQGSLTSQIPTKLYTSHKSTNFVTPPYARPYLSSRAKGQFFVPQWPDRPGSGQAHACLMHPSGELQNCGREGPAAGGSGRRAPCGGAPYKKDPLALKAARGSRTIFGSGLLSHMTLCSIIGDGELNFRVRNGVGCTLSSMATKEICQNIETGMEGFSKNKTHGLLVLVSSTPHRASTSSLSTRSSTSALQDLRQGELILRQASRLDAFSGYPFHT